MPAEREPRISPLAFLRSTRGAWAVLGTAMLAAAALILYATDGQGFAIDELFYYGRLIADEGTLVDFAPFSPTYLLGPFNGHLALGGRFVYESVFATVGAHYTVFVLINVASLCACAALVFTLTRRRLGDLAAVAPCIAILFLGFAREQLLWPLDFNTSAALAAGLGAVLCLQREDRRGDILACALLTASVALIEVGLAFMAGIALMIVVRPDRLRRLWIILVPIVLYAAWYLWARRFGQSETDLANVVLVPKTIFNAVAAVLGSLSGTNPVQPGGYGTEVTWFGRALALLAAVALVLRIRRGSLPITFWAWIVVAVTYWALLAVADRPPQASRYILVGAVLAILIAADAVRKQLSGPATATLFVLVAIALPANVDALLAGRHQDVLHADIAKSRVEFAMLDLAGERVDPGYMVSADPRVVAVGGGLFLGLPAGAYLDAAADNGSIGFSLEEVRRQPEELRVIADAALAGALGLELRPAAPPRGARECEALAPGAGAASAELAPGRTFLLAHGRRPVTVGLRRFASAGEGVPIARLRPGGWAAIAIPRDSAREPWRIVADGPVTACTAN
jgi:hypothetical protein